MEVGKGEAKSVFAVVMSLISAVVAVCSIWLTVESERQSQRVASVNAYLHLNDDFNKATQAIPVKYLAPDASVPPPGTPGREAIESYWYLTFDEWYITNRLNPQDSRELWDQFYRHAIEDMLEKPVPRAVACKLIADNFDRNRLMTDYGRVLETIYAQAKERRTAKLCP